MMRRMWQRYGPDVTIFCSGNYWPAACADARPSGPTIRMRRLSQIPRHLLRISCRWCKRIVEVQKVMPSACRKTKRSGRRGNAAARQHLPAAHWPHEEDGAGRLMIHRDCIGRLRRCTCHPAVWRHRKAMKKELGKARAMMTLLRDVMG